MTDLSMTITPKSDQLNADDLIAEPKTIQITKVSANPGSSEQPISVYFEGDNGKPYKPCKSMRRVLVQVWGKNGAGYVGKRMTLFRDPTVQWGGVAVGGIRISHMSDIDAPQVLVLTASRASRKPYTVEPLSGELPPTKKNGDAATFEDRATALMERLKSKKTREGLDSAMSKGAVLRGALETAGRGMLLDQIQSVYDECVRGLKDEREPGEDA